MSPFYVSCNVSPLSYCTTDIHELFTTIACLQHENETLNQQNAFLRKQIEDFQRQIMSLKEMNGIVPGLLRATEHQSENPENTTKEWKFEDYNLYRQIVDDLKKYCFEELGLKDAETYRACTSGEKSDDFKKYCFKELGFKDAETYRACTSGEKLSYKVYLRDFVNQNLQKIVQRAEDEKICTDFIEKIESGDEITNNGKLCLKNLLKNRSKTTEDSNIEPWNMANEILWSFFVSDLISNGKETDLQSEMWTTTPS